MRFSARVYATASIYTVSRPKSGIRPPGPVCHATWVSAFKDPEIEISVKDADALLRSGEAVLVDVREPHEWDAGRIPGARHVQLEHLASQAETIPRDTRVIFQCRLGVRSAM